tara:strand:+ start:851 stop:1165 length:315 start_codon:yes stop_codon:yes gene_type:complete
MILDKEKVNNAILVINPDAECVWDTSDTSDIQWLGGTSLISDADLQTKIAELDAKYDSLAYSRARATEYPPYTDYLDGVVKGDETQKQKYIDDCNAVKLKYPKG